jgi:FkbM family methyltransferase
MAHLIKRILRSLSGKKKKVKAKAGIVECFVNGIVMRLDLDEAIQKSISVGGYEPDQTAWVKECLKPGSRYVDIGANFGYYTTLAATLVGPSGSVFAFEPSPTAFHMLNDTITRNHLSNITLVQAAVTHKNGQLDLYMPVDSPVHSPSSFFSDPKFKKISVPAIALDDFPAFKDGLPIDMMKIDVEGSEPDVIMGAMGLLKSKTILNLVCEMNSGWLKRNQGASPLQLTKLIEDAGYCRKKETDKVIGLEPDGQTTFELQDIWFTLR